MIDGAGRLRRFSLVEPYVAGGHSRGAGSPHTREDEYSFVLKGRWARAGDDVVRWAPGTRP